jgi:hypothetical protein
MDLTLVQCKSGSDLGGFQRRRQGQAGQTNTGNEALVLKPLLLSISGPFEIQR